MSRDVPDSAVEIEITPEMIEAGRKAILTASDDIGPTSAELLAEAVFRDMLAASGRERHSTPPSDPK
jgi:hypothetical protein